MLEPMTVRPEVYLLTADAAAVWSLTRRPLLGDPVPADSTIEHEIGLMLYRAGFGGARAALHQTSDRQDGPHLIATHAAVFPLQDTAERFALDLSPLAAPVGAELVEAYGPPATHAADTFPTEIRGADVLQHLLRHLAFLVRYDATARRELGPQWREHLRPLQPALFRRLYATPHAS